jgi:hypothetical protein
VIWAVDIDLPYVADYTLGAILLISGLIAMAMSGIAHLKQRRARADHSAGFGQTYRY